MKFRFAVLASLPLCAVAAVSHQTTYVGADLYQGANLIEHFATEQACVEDAQSRPVSESTTFVCRSQTQILATVTEDPPADSDGDGVTDAVDACPQEPGPAPGGCPIVPEITKYVSVSGGLTACTAIEPCSLQRAADTAVPGDVILVTAGTYGTVTLTRSGTQTQLIEFRADNAVIENPNGYGLYLRRVSYVTLDGFTVRNTRYKALASRDASAAAPVRGLTIRHFTVSNSRQEGLYLSHVADSLIEDNTITQVGLDLVETTGHGIYLANAGSDGTTIRRNTIMIGASRGAGIHINGDEGNGGDGVISNLTIERNVLEGGIKGVSGDGLQDSRIANNLIYNVRQHGIRGYKYDALAGPKGLVIVNNTVRATIANYGSGVKLSDERGPSVIFNNILVGTDRNYWTGTASNNLTTWAVNADYTPTAIAKDQGAGSLAGANAPADDLVGNVRDEPPSIGALE